MKTRILSVFAFLLLLSLPLQAQVCGPNGCLPSGMAPMRGYTPPPTRIYTPASAPTRETPCPAVARISIDCGSYTNKGSGTLLDTSSTEGLVITNAHLIDIANPRKIEVIFPEGTYQGTLIGKDPNIDIALIRIPKPKTYPIKVAKTGAKVGDRVRRIGYGQGQYRMASGVVQSTGWSMMISGTSRDGDSGGPIINQAGEFVGVLWGTTNSQTAATNLPQIKECVDRFILPWNAQLEGQKTQAQSEREQALIAAIQRSQGGTDPALIQRIEALELIAKQAQTYMPSPGVPTLAPPITPETSLAPPFTPTPAEQKPLEPDSSSSEKSGGGWSIGGVLIQPLYLWLGGFGIAGWIAVRLLKGTGLGALLGNKAGGVAGVGVDLAASGVDKITDFTPWKWDDRLIDPIAYKIAEKAKEMMGQGEEPKKSDK